MSEAAPEVSVSGFQVRAVVRWYGRVTAEEKGLAEGFGCQGRNIGRSPRGASQVRAKRHQKSACLGFR